MPTYLAMGLLGDALRLVAVLLGRDTVGRAEGAGEVGRAWEAAERTDGVDGSGAHRGVGERTARAPGVGSLQPGQVLGGGPLHIVLGVIDEVAPTRVPCSTWSS